LGLTYFCFFSSKTKIGGEFTKHAHKFHSRIKVKSSQLNLSLENREWNLLLSRKRTQTRFCSFTHSHRDMNSHCFLRFPLSCFLLFAFAPCCFSHPSLLGVHPLGRYPCNPFASKHQSLNLFSSGCATQVKRCSILQPFFFYLCIFCFIIVSWCLGADEKYYSSEVIKCKDGSKYFTRDRLNDNFCDCPDGTDEPGMYLCKIMSFVVVWFLTSRWFYGSGKIWKDKNFLGIFISFFSIVFEL